MVTAKPEREEGSNNMEWLEKALAWILNTLSNIGIFFIYHPWLSAIIVCAIIVIISITIIRWRNR